MPARKSAGGVLGTHSGGPYNSLAYGPRCSLKQVNGGAREASGALPPSAFAALASCSCCVARCAA